ncbi:MAG: hypothetical protein WA421_06475 [Nitrososphaeraceae archaeon]
MTIQRFTEYSINTVLYLTQDGMIPKPVGLSIKRELDTLLQKIKENMTSKSSTLQLFKNYKENLI